METTERIVEAYVRYIKGWATIPNIRCGGQNEIDLVAIDPLSLDRYHIETSISISKGFQKLTAKPFDSEKVKQRVQKAGQRRTIGFFAKQKFEAPTVVERLKEMGFKDGEYTRVIATWGWTNEAAEQAEVARIELWDFRGIIREIAETIRGSRTYFPDDTLRTLNLFIHASDEAERSTKATPTRQYGDARSRAEYRHGGGYWIYNNWTHDYAAVHTGDCPYCNEGRGTQSSTSKANGEWIGPFASADIAFREATATGRRDIRPCKFCTPVKSD